MSRIAFVFLLALACGRATSSPPPPPEAVSASASASQATPIVVTDPAQVPDLVGKLVTLVGEQTRTKQPTVLGVDVDPADATLEGAAVQVTGVLRRTIVDRDPNDGAPPDEAMATRGPGTYYWLADPRTGEPAVPVAR